MLVYSLGSGPPFPSSLEKRRLADVPSPALFIFRPACTERNHQTCPRTDEGRAASSQNNLRHGFTGAFQVFDSERQQDFEDLLARFSTEHQPSSPYEIVMVERMTQHFWLSQRALRLQEQCFRPDLDM